MLLTEPMIRAAPAIALAKHFEVQKLDFKSVARAADFPADTLTDPMHTVPLRSMDSLILVATQGVGDCGFPIKLAQVSVVGNSCLLGHLAMSAPTVEAFLECLGGYTPILVTGCQVSFSESGGVGRLVWQLPVDFEAPRKPLSLYTVAGLVYRIRAVVGAGLTPLLVSVEHKAPAATQTEMSVFGKRVTLNADETPITIDAATLTRRLPSANEELFAIFKHLMAPYCCARCWASRILQAGCGMRFDSA